MRGFTKSEPYRRVTPNRKINFVVMHEIKQYIVSQNKFSETNILWGLSLLGIVTENSHLYLF